ncbi:MAG TPA: hypothetical protein VJC07_01425 [Candidatus Nanoarchaeia archaeon]|nr:hypothetical protein [Candidatus Nanoarchaeia archaeon]
MKILNYLLPLLPFIPGSVLKGGYTYFRDEKGESEMGSILSAGACEVSTLFGLSSLYFLPEVPLIGQIAGVVMGLTMIGIRVGLSFVDRYSEQEKEARLEERLLENIFE